MEQEDYLKRQIDQLGRVLGKILADLIGLQTGGLVSDGIETVSHALKGELYLDIDELLYIPGDRLINALQAKGKMSFGNFEQLAGILFLLAENLDKESTPTDRKKKLYERSLILFRHVDETSSTFSFDRHDTIRKIKCKIENLE